MDTQIHSSDNFREYCERTYAAAKPESVTHYAVGAFLESAAMPADGDVTAESLKHWVGSMLMGGMKPSTAKRYLGRLHTLFNDWVSEYRENPFAVAIPALSDAFHTDSAEAVRNLSLIKRLLSKNQSSDEWQSIAIFLYLLYNVDATLLDVVGLTFADAQKFCPQIDDIVEAQSSSFGRKYVFNLKQGKSRPERIYNDLIASIDSVLRAAGMRFPGGFSRDSITAMWISAALGLGIDLHTVRAMVTAVPAEYAALTLIKKHEFTESERQAVICEVANAINDNASRWFVMKMRPGVKVGDIRKRIGNLPSNISKGMTLFYPVRGIVKRRGKRTVKDEEPYLPDLLFFKTQRYKVRSLFAAIGDLSWCFRTSGLPGSEYSVIPNKEMTRFQQCVGQFTPDVKMELMDIDRPLERGRKVRIVGGIMAGYEGEIIDVEGEPGMRMFFLKIANMTRAAWKVRVEDVFIEPLDN